MRRFKPSEIAILAVGSFLVIAATFYFILYGAAHHLGKSASWFPEFQDRVASPH